MEHYVLPLFDVPAGLNFSFRQEKCTCLNWGLNLLISNSHMTLLDWYS